MFKHYSTHNLNDLLFKKILSLKIACQIEIRNIVDSLT